MSSAAGGKKHLSETEAGHNPTVSGAATPVLETPSISRVRKEATTLLGCLYCFT